MVHRAPLGSPERFIGILIEHFAGAFPLWLSPVQVTVLPISDKTNDYAATVVAALREAGIRVELDDSPEKVGAKIRNATMAKVPYMVVVGAKEAEAGVVALRSRTGGDQGTRGLAELTAGLRREIDSKGAQKLVESCIR
jgi:threonyl-tRNA synthetase